MADDSTTNTSNTLNTLNTSSETSLNIDCLKVTIPRSSIQGGLTNEELDENNLKDWRCQHHITTDYVKLWKNYKTVGKDSKFTDIESIEDPSKKAEGKKLTSGVTLSPSVDTGANRSFNQLKLEKCFEINSHYYLYDRGEITDTTIEFLIYWIPINIIKSWYVNYGNRKGKISKLNIDKCIKSCEINYTEWNRS